MIKSRFMPASPKRAGFCYNRQMDNADIKKRIEGIEGEMQGPYFWNDKIEAQKKIKELQELKDKLEGLGKYDKGGAVMAIFSGAGGDDAEDFSRMLLEMYQKYADNQGWSHKVLHSHPNENGGYRNVTIEIEGKNVYKNLKNE